MYISVAGLGTRAHSRLCGDSQSVDTLRLCHQGHSLTPVQQKRALGPSGSGTADTQLTRLAAGGTPGLGQGDEKWDVQLC